MWMHKFPVFCSTIQRFKVQNKTRVTLNNRRDCKAAPEKSTMTFDTQASAPYLESFLSFASLYEWRCHVSSKLCYVGRDANQRHKSRVSQGVAIPMVSRSREKKTNCGDHHYHCVAKVDHYINLDTPFYVSHSFFYRGKLALVSFRLQLLSSK